jgi:23S rRNA (uracil1939-C5)-methyltransferase
MTLTIGAKIDIIICGYGSSGEGIANFADYTVFVPYTLIGETVTACVTYVKKSICYARLLSVVVPSPDRVAPPCPHFTECGGCQLQHMNYPAQLAFKRDKVARNLQKIAQLSVDVLPTVASPRQFGYRNKITLPVGGKSGDILFGMYRRDSHHIVPTGGCLLAATWAEKLLAILKIWADKNGVVPYNETDFSGHLRHVTARHIGGQLLVTLVTNGACRCPTRPLIELLQKEFPIFGLFVNENCQHNNVILGDKTRHIFGIKEISARHFGVDFVLQPNSFFQVNDGIKDQLYAEAKRLLSGSQIDTLVDCFSGVGLLTSALVSENYDTYAIEIEPSAVADADKLKAKNNLPRLTNICGDVNIELPKLMLQLAGKHTALVVDPPRKGLGDNICRTILAAHPETIIYISCDSATLARDLKQLSSMYTPTYVRPYDMFPHCDDVETLVLLSHNSSAIY